MHTRVAVIRGGPSEEHEVSIQTGEHMLSSLPRALYAPVDIVITKSGEWLRNGRSRTPLEALQGVDVVLIALHGAYGEDGTLQRELDLLGIPYTGSTAYPSTLAMHKAIAKDHVRRNGVRVARHMVVGRSALSNISGMARSLFELFNTHMVIKPVAGGSSLGVHMATHEHDLADALHECITKYGEALVEERIVGIEATVGVIDGFRGIKHYALPPIEVLSGGDIYDYDAKYAVREHGRISNAFSHDIKRELERLAQVVHTTLGLRHYSRSDFIVSADGIYFLEANSLPGCTEQSFLPFALTSVGSSMSEFLEHILTRALNRELALVA